MTVGGRLIRTALRSSSLGQIRHVSQVRFNEARDLVAEVYSEMEREFGVLAPPVALHAPVPEVLAGCWLVLRETLVVPGAIPRSTKEAVAAAVSVSNTCPYCVTIHSSTMRALVPGSDATALANDHAENMSDPRVRAISVWARTLADADVAGRTEPPFPAGDVPELLGVAVAFHYINRMVNVFLGEMPMPSVAPAAAIGPVMRVLVGLMRSAAPNIGAPGASLDLLPGAPLPEDMSWAKGNLAIAEAYARFAAGIEEASREPVSAAVRDLLLSQLTSWDGRHKGPSRAWVEDVTAALPDTDRAAGRLALLTAFASYQVDQGVIDAFRAVQPGDQALVGLTSWASLTTAREIGSRARTDGR
jgi:AhpD family alkylhydroperoxidase